MESVELILGRWLGRLFRRQPKVFCIGYNKTGTTTLEKVLTDLGYRMPNQELQEARVVEPFFRGDYSPLLKLCREFDAFQDMPFSQGVTYAIVDAMFPGSKFILSVRDSNQWFSSLARFHLQGILKKAGVERLEDFDESSFRDKDIYLHKNYLQQVVRRHAAYVVDNEVRFDWSLVYNQDHRTKIYERRNAEIVMHFHDRRSQLLVIDLDKESSNARIVEFLGRPKTCIQELPRMNTSQ